MKTVHEVSRISGISIRTLHHYDAIGLLKPTEVTESGYRLYGDAALHRLQIILMYRELGFALADIRMILDNPDFDVSAALLRHIEMLEQQRAHIDALIAGARKIMKGENADFSVFDRTEMKQYENEVKERWGKTKAYREAKENEGKRSDTEKQAVTDQFLAQFAYFGALKGKAPDSPIVQDAVKALQDFITMHYYRCTDEILAGLGEMYLADERFRTTIDNAGGAGTADFVVAAIRIFTKHSD